MQVAFSAAEGGVAVMVAEGGVTFPKAVSFPLAERGESLLVAEGGVAVRVAEGAVTFPVALPVRVPFSLAERGVSADG